MDDDDPECSADEAEAAALFGEMLFERAELLLDEVQVSRGGVARGIGVVSPDLSDFLCAADDFIDPESDSKGLDLSLRCSSVGVDLDFLASPDLLVDPDPTDGSVPI